MKANKGQNHGKCDFSLIIDVRTVFYWNWVGKVGICPPNFNYSKGIKNYVITSYRFPIYYFPSIFWQSSDFLNTILKSRSLCIVSLYDCTPVLLNILKWSWRSMYLQITYVVGFMLISDLMLVSEVFRKKCFDGSDK